MENRPTLVALSEEEQRLVSEVEKLERKSSASELEQIGKKEERNPPASESINHCQVRGKGSALKVLVRTNPKTVTQMPDFHLVQDKILNMKVRIFFILMLIMSLLGFSASHRRCLDCDSPKVRYNLEKNWVFLENFFTKKWLYRSGSI